MAVIRGSHYHFTLAELSPPQLSPLRQPPRPAMPAIASPALFDDSFRIYQGAPSNVMATSVNLSSVESQIGVYECEITLKLRILEENRVMQNREQLLELLMDAFSYGSDEFVEALHSQLSVTEIPEVEASPLMRRQLIRLRNTPQL
jgi:hypothetical protein